MIDNSLKSYRKPNLHIKNIAFLSLVYSLIVYSSLYFTPVCKLPKFATNSPFNSMLNQSYHMKKKNKNKQTKNKKTITAKNN